MYFLINILENNGAWNLFKINDNLLLRFTHELEEIH
jgi:hypothetical protein